MPAMTVQQVLNLATQHLQSERLSEAESLCRQILVPFPTQPHALNLLGRIAQRMGQIDAAIDWFGKATNAAPTVPTFQIDLAQALCSHGRLQPAIAAARRATELNPLGAAEQSNLGSILSQAGRLEEAAEACRRAIALDARFAPAHFGLGSLLARMDQLGEAEAEFRRTLTLDPQYAPAHNCLGNLLARAGRLDAALAACRRAMELQPQYAQAHNELGNVLMKLNRLNEAESAYRSAIELKPDLVEAHNNLAQSLFFQSRLTEAEVACRQALAIDPNYSLAYHNLASAIHAAGRLREQVEAYRRVLDLQPNSPRSHSSLIVTLHYLPEYHAADIAEECSRWDQQHAQPLRSCLRPHENDFNPHRRLRVGYVSPDFRDHVLGKNILPLLREHDRQNVELFGYSNVRWEDDMTRQFQSLADHWRNIVDLSDDQAAELIRSDRVDLLVDLALHSADNRLPIFARKPAPVQISFAGYPGRTGLSTMDYRLTDRFLDPPDDEPALRSETPLRLADSFWCYDPTAMGAPAERPQRDDVMRGDRVITFGCLCNFVKASDFVVRLWAQILTRVDGASLLLMAPQGEARDRIRGLFAEARVDTKRVEFVTGSATAEYFKLFERFDISLDPFPYNGHTSSLDSLWMNVPVVSLSGSTGVSRGGRSILSNIGLPELVAQTAEQYVQIAAGLARDRVRLAELHATLRDRMLSSPLVGARRFAGNVEDAFRTAWHWRCGQVQNDLGDSLAQQNRLVEAEAAFRRAIELKPGFVQAHNNLGGLLTRLHRLHEAEAQCREILALDPSNPFVYHNLGCTLGDMGRLDEAIAAHRRALELKSDYVQTHSTLIQTLHYHPDATAPSILAEARRFAQVHERPLQAALRPHDNDRSPDRRLRIGYVSPDFREHSVASFVERPLACHDHEQFEIFCYADVGRPDAVTERLRGFADHFRMVNDLTDERLAEMIRLDCIDILIDLAGHTAANRMLVFARKPSPVQISYLGYPGTTGLAATDYRLTDAYADPPGLTESHYTERLIRLPETFLCYAPHADISLSPDLPGIAAGHVTFGSFNAMGKINAPLVAIWSHILRRVTGSKLVLKNVALGDRAVQEHLRNLFAANTIAPERLELLSATVTREQHLRCYHRIDIALDTFPYHGTTTTCEAIWMGVPVVTLAGDRHVSRVGATILSNLGLPDLIADSTERYIDLAVDLASDLPRLAAIRKTLGHRMEESPLTDGVRFTRILEAAYRNLWRDWCTDHERPPR
jgi:predicted O-linked N-acetylglucosamine transferase (SPINDLY family)